MIRELAITIIRERGFSVTFPRTFILSLLIGGHRLVSLQDIIILSGKKINRVTAYRTLIFFCEVGLFYKVLDNKNKAYYALDSGLIDKAISCNEHFHFKCKSCGSVLCLPLRYVDEPLPEGFVKTDANLLLLGYCPDCSGDHKHTENVKRHYEI